MGREVERLWHGVLVRLCRDWTIAVSLPPDSSQQLCFVNDFDTERASLIELAAWIRAREHEARGLAHSTRHSATGFLDHRGRLRAAERRQGTGDDDRQPSQGTVSSRFPRLLQHEPVGTQLRDQIPRRWVLEIVV